MSNSANNINFAIPHLMEINPDRESGLNCAPLMHSNYAVRGVMDLRDVTDTKQDECPPEPVTEETTTEETTNE